ncbi:MAG: hypothetical protein JWP21_2310, partial [Tardiphaga sp.]|nr:hypothetical protein [Tardiphaga sp.]
MKASSIKLTTDAIVTATNTARQPNGTIS